MKLKWTRARLDAAVVAVLAFVIALGWALQNQFIGPQRIVDPLAYGGDAQLALAAVAVGSRGEYLPFFSKLLPSLGAPFVASWNDWPITEDFLIFFLGGLARLVGSAGAINLGFVVACMTGGASMFFVARRYGARRETAALAGLLFGLSNFIWARGVHHYGLIFVWSIPWNILVGSWLASRRGIPFGSRRFLLAAAVTVGTGLGFIYYSFFTAQLYVLGTAAGAFRYGWNKRRFKPIFVLAFLLTAAIGSMHLDSALYIIEHGRNGASIQRAKSDAETYALKPINFFAPGGNHRLEFMRTVSNRAAAQSVISGEFPSPYLGMEAALALCALGVFAMRLVARGRTGLVVGWASTALWLTLAHSTGGINSFLGLLDVRLFRSVNRVSVVVLAIALLFGTWWLGRLLAGKKPLVRWLAVAALGAFGVWEQLPRSDSPETIAANRRAAESDRKLVTQMENALPHGAMVFELPVMDFPEVPPFGGVDSYEMFRPTLYARSLRFSHGDVKGRPNAGWKFRVASLPLPQMLQELRSAGFSGLYVNRKGFPDGGAALVRELGVNGCRVIAEAELHDTLALAL